MSDAPGYFGQAARMSGSGTYPFVNWPDRLNAITTAMTVAFWVRPDRDYVSGGVWNWSFGRQDTWRLGFYGSGVKFEVFPPSGASHSTQAVYPLYAGRWYHLAATMKTWSTRTNLSLFVDGQLVAWTNESSYTVKTGNALLYLGWDQATVGATFRGIVDEFRLYKRALTQNSTRGLLWFTGGSNNLLIPRGVFYDSKMYVGLNGSFDATSPLKGAVVNGNDNTLSSNLNSRVIQLVITKNVTLADAWRILDLARTNTSGSVTAFPFFATSEFHTLGFAWEVSKLAPNTSVVNGRNFSAPPPPLDLWALFWNTIAGWAERAWNAVTAVWAFFVAVGKWLAQAFMSVVKGLTTGDWNDFQNQVLKPLADALEKFLKFVIDLVVGLVKAIFQPLLNAYQEMVRQVQAALSYAVRATLSAALAATLGAIFLSTFGILLVAGFVALTIVMKLAESTGIGKILGIVIGVIVAIYVVVQLVDTLFNTRLSDMVPGGFDKVVDWSYTLAGFVLSASLAIAGALRGWKTFDDAVADLFGSALCLIMLSIATAADKAGGKTLQGKAVKTVADGVALAIAWGGDLIGINYPITPNVGIFKTHSILAPMAKALDFYAKATTISSFLTDLYDVMTFAPQG